MSGAWDLDKVDAFSDEFFNFLKYVRINSKEMGNIVLADHVYRAQQVALNGIFCGLAQDIHWFDILKSRQLGISTLLRALSLFWLGIHDGLKGYSIMDTDGHKEESRLEILAMIESLPPEVDFPRVRRQNRYLIELENYSLLNFASAGVRSSKGSGTLGRSSGVNFCHVSEMCSIDNIEGIESFKNSLAEDFPNRLYIWESTARGFNQRHEMWEEAKADPTHKKTIFIGWYHKDNQKIERWDADFARYGAQAPSEKETKKIVEVKKLYDWNITAEQLAWIRRKMDPTAEAEGDAEADYSGNPLRVQEQPWTEFDAFQMTGATFFEPERLTEIANATVSKKFKAHTFVAGLEFSDCKWVSAYNQRSIELKVWEEPVDDAIYVIASDVAFGINEKNDRSATQVLRCYADGIDQVAEYAWPLINSKQYAWVIASLLGWYGSGTAAECYLILELNGPGEATWNELQSLKRELQYGYQRPNAEERGLQNIFGNVRNYIYGRSDSMSPGRNWQFLTNTRLKVSIMERLRDFTSNKMLTVRSHDTVEEMKAVTRDGDSIEAQGSKKDDRVLALALGIRCWEDRARRNMLVQRRTRSNEEAKRRMTIRDLIQVFNEHQLTTFFTVKQQARRRAEQAAARAGWRGAAPRRR